MHLLSFASAKLIDIDVCIQTTNLSKQQYISNDYTNKSSPTFAKGLMWTQASHRVAVVLVDAAFAMAGTALVYPGWQCINWGVHLQSAPFVVTGIGAVYVPWAVVPLLTVVLVTFLFLVLRTFLMRGDDPFHQVLWVSIVKIPMHASLLSSMMLLYAQPECSSPLHILVLVTLLT